MRVSHASVAVLLCAIAAAAMFTGLPAALADGDPTRPAPPGSITFIAKNMVATANGTFHQWRFTKANFDPDAPAGAEVEIEVDIASIDTKIEKRDDHLRSADFFDVENHPTATLRIYDIRSAGDGAYTATLDWTMHGVQKTYENFAFELIETDPVRVKGTFTVNRMDFNIGEPHKLFRPTSIQEDVPITFEATLPENV